ncbi:MAG: hypothetical protein OCC49_18930 [Fibrobacterales bacterium]
MKNIITLFSVIILQAFVGCSASKPLKETNEYHFTGDVKDLLDTTVAYKTKTIEPIYIDGKSHTFISPEFPDYQKIMGKKMNNPRQLLLSNLDCWSKVSSDASCRTEVLFSDSSKQILQIIKQKSFLGWLQPDETKRKPKRIFVFKEPDHKLFHSLPFNDEALVTYFRMRSDIKSITTFKEEPPSMASIVVVGIMVATPAFLASMVIESVVYAIDKNYSWKRVGIYTGSMVGGVMGLGLVLWTGEISVKIVKVDF